MPFWWARRRRPWYPRWRKRRYTRRRKYGRYQRRRRRYRTTNRRRGRRRRKRKVRRKQKQITIKQWNPDCIQKCKIKGFGYLVAGAQGSQFRCYTNSKEEYTQPKAPGGGSFGCEVFTLEYLFNQWVAHKNIWTKSNDYKELVRYCGCKFTFFKHIDTDFIVSYERQPPFTFQKDTYQHLHPLKMLLAKHHRILSSIQRKRHGRNSITLKIKPPKGLTTKWFFQREFATYPLLKLNGTATNFSYSLFGPNTQSPNITIPALNTYFYTNANWAQNRTEAWYPYIGYPTTNPYIYTTASGKTAQPQPTNYKDSISFSKGFFQPNVLQAVSVKQNSTSYHYLPIVYGRYNPEEDTGHNNQVWLTTVVSNKQWQPTTNPDLIFAEEPLYVIFFGIYDWIKSTKGGIDLLKSGMFVVKSPAIKPISATTQTVWPILDMSFILGKMPYDETPKQQDLDAWYPTTDKQLQIINSIVESGPLTPKYSNLKSSTWQLPYLYTFYFKWGGSQITDQLIQDPKTQETYTPFYKEPQAVQVADPLKQIPETIFKPWDYRRGILTRSALKRMRENLSTNASIQPDETESPKKKKKVTSQIQHNYQSSEETSSYLQEICEKDTFPQEETDLQQLIYNQYHQQQNLKQNIYKVLNKLKKKQRQLLLQTGFL
nr:MAG: ORF1 [Torque teno midi virus]UHK05285.1 MAG: ORF1 [Torque teno midi virus]